LTYTRVRCTRCLTVGYEVFFTTFGYKVGRTQTFTITLTIWETSHWHTMDAQDHPHLFSFIFSFKTEYYVPIIQILFLKFTSPASIFLHVSPSSKSGPHIAFLYPPPVPTRRPPITLPTTPPLSLLPFSTLFHSSAPLLPPSSAPLPPSLARRRWRRGNHAGGRPPSRDPRVRAGDDGECDAWLGR
jgi:hypothetical protein